MFYVLKNLKKICQQYVYVGWNECVLKSLDVFLGYK